MMSNANRSGALLCFIANMIEDGSHPKIDVESGWPIVDCGFVVVVLVLVVVAFSFYMIFSF